LSPQCIIFDCDGVLVDSEAISAEVFVALTRPLGLVINEKQAVEIFAGQSLNWCFSYIEDKINSRLPADFERTYRQHTFSAFQSKLKPIEGIYSLLERIQIPYCVASSGPIRKIQLNLKITGLLSNFEDRIFSCYEINSWKPEPDIFLYAAKTMGYQPKDCIVVEDSVAGVQAAKAGGFKVFGYANSLKRKKQLENEGAVVFQDMNLLDQLIYQDVTRL
jgi:HAD superfamily hydrolase (TIGR01509 family)